MQEEPFYTTDTVREAVSAALRRFHRSLRVRLAIAAGALLSLVLLYASFSAPRIDHTFPKIVSIEKGSTVRGAGETLEALGIISSPTLFKDYVILFGGESGLKAGDYLFDAPMSVVSAARRLSGGEGRLLPVKVTIPEGTDVSGIADILALKLAVFDRDRFIELAAHHEGYLFPDTYFFSSSEPSEHIIEIMTKTFAERVGPLMQDIEASGRSLADVVSMASILEREARTKESREMVAGILWKRLAIGMPLQVDAAFSYVNGKDSSNLTLDDLARDHPYNTYTNQGLPPGPISNPGLDAIRAAISPTRSAYLYYLTDRNGVMRYARTHDEHVINKQIYLR